MDFGLQLYYKLNINLNWFITGEGEMFNIKESSNNSSYKETEQIVIGILKEKGLIQ